MCGECGGVVDFWCYVVFFVCMSYGESYNVFGDDMFGVVIKEFIGVVLIIMFWNFLFWIFS